MDLVVVNTKSEDYFKCVEDVADLLTRKANMLHILVKLGRMYKGKGAIHEHEETIALISSSLFSSPKNYTERDSTFNP